MKLFTKTMVGRIVKATAGLLNGKHVMIAKEVDKGFGVICDPTEWPAEIPADYNALFVNEDDIVEIPKEAETMLQMKFPDPKQFE